MINLWNRCHARPTPRHIVYAVARATFGICIAGISSRMGHRNGRSCTADISVVDAVDATVVGVRVGMVVVIGSDTDGADELAIVSEEALGSEIVGVSWPYHHFGDGAGV